MQFQPEFTPTERKLERCYAVLRRSIPARTVWTKRMQISLPGRWERLEQAKPDQIEMLLVKRRAAPSLIYATTTDQFGAHSFIVGSAKPPYRRSMHAAVTLSFHKRRGPETPPPHTHTHTHTHWHPPAHVHPPPPRIRDPHIFPDGLSRPQ
jgi:hypothetical protein